MASTFAPSERRVYSQNGEDGVLHALFRELGSTNRVFVEFGCEDGRQRNTRLLEEKGWSGLLMSRDARPSQFDIQCEHVTAENVNGLFAKYNVPNEFDLLSIDIDGNDYWVWKALSPTFRPRVVAIEYNGALGCERSVTIPYDPGFVWDGSEYFGASLPALERLGREKGYRLIYCERAGVNAFFVRNDLVPPGLHVPALSEVFHPFHGHWRRNPKAWVEV